MTNANRLELIANVAASYLRRNSTNPDQIATVIANITRALDEAAGTQAPVQEQSLVQEPPSAETSPRRPQPAVPVSKSVQREHVVCLEDGIRARTLKKHLSVAHGMTPDEYRARWGLPADYPMVAPEYSERRSAMAKSIGLGRKSGRGRKRSRTAQRRR